MPASLEVFVNRSYPNVLEAPAVYETSEDFFIEVTNDGKPVHLHVNCDDDLAAGISFETGNHFIPREDEFILPIKVDQDTAPFRGKLRLSIGYGSEVQYVELRVSEPEPNDHVHVDESLAQPQARNRPTTVSARILSDVGVAALLVIGVLALIAGGVTIAAVTTPIVGVLLVITVVLLAVGIYALLSED